MFYSPSTSSFENAVQKGIDQFCEDHAAEGWTISGIIAQKGVILTLSREKDRYALQILVELDHCISTTVRKAIEDLRESLPQLGS